MTAGTEMLYSSARPAERRYLAMRDRLFFPQEALDLWLSDSRAELTDKELLIKAEGRRYHLMDAIRVLEEVTGSEDVYGIVGRVKSVAFLTELGAELLGSSMLIGEHAYEVVPGFLCTPMEMQGSEEQAPPARAHDPEDAALLARYLEHNLE